jgi:hypothetical protein
VPEAPDQAWQPAANADDAPLYYLPTRSDPYLIRVGTKFVKVQILFTGELPEAAIDLAERTALVAKATSEPRGRKS